MKKMMIAMLVTMMLLAAAAANAQDAAQALQAFAALTGTQAALQPPQRTSEEYLDKVMAGDYLAEPADTAAAAEMALELNGLSEVTTKDIAVYAAAKAFPAARVRNQYFLSLANVLKAEILVNPASEEEYRNIQVILSLFLNESDDDASYASRETIRRNMTAEYAVQIAGAYSLPKSFVEFIIMDENWDDDDWKNDNSWQAGSDWNTDNLFEDSLEDYIDTDGIDGNSLDSIDLNSVDSVDYDTPDYRSPASVDYNTPDYSSPASVDYDTPDYSSPASVDYDTPDYNSPASVDYDTPDYGSPASVDSVD